MKWSDKLIQLDYFGPKFQFISAGSRSAIFLPVWYHKIKSNHIQEIFWRLKDSHKLVLNDAQPCFILLARAGIMSVCESMLFVSYYYPTC